jgi:hypothetical protein
MLQWLDRIGFGSFFRALVTVALLLATLWALGKVYGVIDKPPTVNDKGEVTLDVYQRAKDILLVVLPLLTTALGYWFGAKESENAKTEKDTAVQEKEKTQRRLTAVLDSSQTPLWEAAKLKDAAAFEQ